MQFLTLMTLVSFWHGRLTPDSGLLPELLTNSILDYLSRVTSGSKTMLDCRARCHEGRLGTCLPQRPASVASRKRPRRDANCHGTQNFLRWYYGQVVTTLSTLRWSCFTKSRQGALCMRVPQHNSDNSCMQTEVRRSRPSFKA